MTRVVLVRLEDPLWQAMSTLYDAATDRIESLLIIEDGAALLAQATREQTADITEPVTLRYEILDGSERYRYAVIARVASMLLPG